jgi:hypothetical protein
VFLPGKAEIAVKSRQVFSSPPVKQLDFVRLHSVFGYLLPAAARMHGISGASSQKVCQLVSTIGAVWI